MKNYKQTRAIDIIETLISYFKNGLIAENEISIVEGRLIAKYTLPPDLCDIKYITVISDNNTIFRAGISYIVQIACSFKTYNFEIISGLGKFHERIIELLSLMQDRKFGENFANDEENFQIQIL